ncbi:MAG: glycosyltransferase [Candidatus Diapherotrites archaeon]|nr:glycosyltransferase [Candidatus Diapherotrites archaeon]
MKIFLVVPYADPEKGAAIVRVNSFRDYFQSQSHSVQVIAPLRKGLESAQTIFRYKNILQLIKFLLSNNFDVLLATSPPIVHAFFSLLICKLKRKPFVLDSKDLFTHTAIKLGLLKKGSLKFYIYRFMEIVTHKWARHILVLDPTLGDRISQLYSVQPEKITAAYNGVDVRIVRKDAVAGKKIREQLNISANAGLIIYLGGLGDERYIDFLQETGNIIKKYNAYILFVIASDESLIAGQRLNEIYACIEQLELKKNFILLKNIPHPEVYKYLSAADIGVDFWPDFEYFAVSVKVLEYMACELSVMIKIPKRNKSYKDFFEKYAVGAALTEWSDFKIHLDAALMNLPSFKEQGVKGAEIIKENFTRDVTSKKVLKILENLQKK